MQVHFCTSRTDNRHKCHGYRRASNTHRNYARWKVGDPIEVATGATRGLSLDMLAVLEFSKMAMIHRLLPPAASAYAQRKSAQH
eukprot:466218-Amphidinium_carterae.1